MSKQNYKFANSSIPTEGKKTKQNLFFSFPGRSHLRVNLRPGLLFAHFLQRISEPGKYRGPTGRVRIICFYCIQVLKLANGLCCFIRLRGGHIFKRVCVVLTMSCKRNSKFRAALIQVPQYVLNNKYLLQWPINLEPPQA